MGFYMANLVGVGDTITFFSTSEERCIGFIYHALPVCQHRWPDSK
jgi:hypothetical protein